LPSNPWLTVGWRQPEQIIVPLSGVFKRRGIEFIAKAAESVLPEDNQVREVCDTKGLPASGSRENDIKWICNQQF